MKCKKLHDAVCLHSFKHNESQFRVVRSSKLIDSA